MSSYPELCCSTTWYAHDGGKILMRSTSKKKIHIRFPWFLFLCFWLWASTGLFFPQAASADAPLANPDTATVAEGGTVTVLDSIENQCVG